MSPACPDLLPPLAVMAAARSGTTRFVNAARLRMKESDRLSTTAALLTALGGRAEEGPDFLTVHGGTLTGGTVDCANDHRIAMAAAIAATACTGPVTMLGRGVRAKVLPGFLGGLPRPWEVTSMSSEFGSLLKISVFGQSHGRAIGVVVDGLPAGEAIDLEELNAFLARRKPGKSPLSTARKEADAPVFLSGLENGVTCGAPLCAVIENGDQHSSDYDAAAGQAPARPRGLHCLCQVGRAGGHAGRRPLLRPADGAPVHRRRHRQADSLPPGRIRRGPPPVRGDGGGCILPPAAHEGAV